MKNKFFQKGKTKKLKPLTRQAGNSCYILSFPNGTRENLLDEIKNHRMLLFVADDSSVILDEEKKKSNELYFGKGSCNCITNRRGTVNSK